MLRRDRETLDAVTGLAWPQEPPPDLADNVKSIHDELKLSPGDALWWTWSIAENGGVEACGGAGFNGPPDADGIIWIGYALYPGARGRGLATDAVETLVSWAFADPRVRVVLASIDPDNDKSCAVARRAGFRFHRRSASMNIYRQTRGQWKARAAR